MNSSVTIRIVVLVCAFVAGFMLASFYKVDLAEFIPQSRPTEIPSEKSASAQTTFTLVDADSEQHTWTYRGKVSYYPDETFTFTLFESEKTRGTLSDSEVVFLPQTRDVAIVPKNGETIFLFRLHARNQEKSVYDDIASKVLLQSPYYERSPYNQQELLNGCEISTYVVGEQAYYEFISLKNNGLCKIPIYSVVSGILIEDYTRDTGISVYSDSVKFLRQ
ncbi:hypothetical protein K2X83_00375 [Patescibacteria group bacterium]|nr:hypothetical protein [Patescibacteria group bacterium]